MKKIISIALSIVLVSLVFITTGCCGHKKTVLEPLTQVGAAKSDNKPATMKSSSSTAMKTFTTKKTRKRKYRSVAVRCGAYTKKGRTCKRKTTHYSGRCWQHR